MATAHSLVLAIILICVSLRASFAIDDWDLGEYEKMEDINNPVVLMMALRNAHAQRLADLEAIARDIDQQIANMQKRKYDITAQKRTHVACLVHVLSCYRKRR